MELGSYIQIPSFNLTINDTSPIWFYCTGFESCNINGMVGVINPANETSYSVQHQAAINALYQLLPRQAWPAEGSQTKSKTTTRKFPPAAIAGIVGSIIILIIIALIA